MNNIDTLFKQKADYYDNTLEAFNSYRTGAYSTNLKLLIWLSDFAFFSLLGCYDLWIVLCDYQKAVKKFQQNYYARQAALICFELLSDISQHLNKNYSSLLVDKIDDTEINERAEEVRKNLNRIRNEYESKFKDIRDLTIAHRDHNISKQIEIINSMDNDWIMSFAIQYLKELDVLHTLINQVIKYLDSDGKIFGKDSFLKKYAV